MSRDMAIALAAGAVSAVAAVSFVAGGPFGMLLGYFAILPILMAILGLGQGPGGIAAMAAFFMAGVLAGTQAAAMFALIMVLPAWLAGRLALLHRTVPGGATQWYPAGDILCWLALLAAALFGGAAAVVWISGNGLEATIAELLERRVETDMAALPDDTRKSLVVALTPLFPGVLGASVVIMTMINAMLAQTLLTRMGRNLRTGTPFFALSLPDWFSWVFVAACILALVGPGELEYLGDTWAIILAVPFFFVGLATVHWAAGRTPFTGMLLVIFYLVLMATGWTAVLVAGIGLIEQWVGIRRLGAPPDDPEEVE